MWRRESREPDLLDFIEFVKDETLMVINSLFAKSDIDQHCERSSKGLQQNSRHTKTVNNICQQSR